MSYLCVEQRIWLFLKRAQHFLCMNNMDGARVEVKNAQNLARKFAKELSTEQSLLPAILFLLTQLFYEAARFIIATVEELVRASESLVPGSAASGPGLVNRPETRLQLELLHILIALRSLLRPFPGRLDQFLNTSLHQHALELSASGHLSEAVGYAFLIRSSMSSSLREETMQEILCQELRLFESDGWFEDWQDIVESLFPGQSMDFVVNAIKSMARKSDQQFETKALLEMLPQSERLRVLVWLLCQDSTNGPCIMEMARACEDSAGSTEDLVQLRAALELRYLLDIQAIDKQPLPLVRHVLSRKGRLTLFPVNNPSLYDCIDLHHLTADLQNLYWKVFDVLVQEVSQMNQLLEQQTIAQSLSSFLDMYGDSVPSFVHRPCVSQGHE